MSPPDAIVCDFCSGPDVAWVYPANPFGLPAWHSLSADDHWAACRACSDLIEAVKPPEILARAYRHGPAKAGPVPPDRARAYERFLRDLYLGFFANRRGPRSPDGPQKAADGHRPDSSGPAPASD